MRLLLYEHLTARAGLDPNLPASLAHEGWAMLSGLCADARGIPDIEVHTLTGLNHSFDSSIQMHRVDPGQDWLESLRNLIGQVDAALIIAPEFNRILETLVGQVESAGKLHLGSTSRGIAITADKWRCHCQWQAHGLPTPQTIHLSQKEAAIEPRGLPYPLVLKPCDGAGSLATILVSDPGAWHTALEEAGPQNPGEAWIAQSFVPGQPASVGCIVGARGIVTLPASLQRLTADGRFHYCGGETPLTAQLSERAQRLARKAVVCMEGLRGYVGVDLVLGAEEDGSEDRAIEINPRITTSYLGLRALCKTNLLRVILATCQDEEFPELAWRTGQVQFAADGSLGFL